MPALIKTNCFAVSQLLKLHDQDDGEGPTYVAQYFAESKALYNRYLELYANDFTKIAIEKWGDGFIDFRTLLEVIE